MKIKVLLVMPGKEPQLVRIPANTKFLKSFIGDNLQRFKLDDETTLICNKDADITEFNRLFNNNILLGTFLIVAVKNKHRVSLKKKAIRKYSNMFKLRKHIRKIAHYKEEYLSQYYTLQCQQKNTLKTETATIKKVA